MASPLERARPAALRLIFAPEPEGVPKVAAAVRSFLEESDVTESELFSLQLCVSEACHNAIRYAEGPAQRLRPSVEALVSPQQIEIRVQDFTPGFNLPERIPPPSPLEERGRGLFLIQSVMDEVIYIRGRHENVLIMRKKRLPHGTHPATHHEAAPAGPLVRRVNVSPDDVKELGAGVAGQVRATLIGFSLVLGAADKTQIERCAKGVGRTRAARCN
jgi:serine/threonine-protein kinase RsbW